MGSAYMASITLHGTQSKGNHDPTSITRTQNDHGKNGSESTLSDVFHACNVLLQKESLSTDSNASATTTISFSFSQQRECTYSKTVDHV